MRTRKVSYAFMGEVIGTGVIGAFLAYLIGLSLLDGKATLLSFVTPYLFSSLLGAVMAFSMFKILEKNQVLGSFLKQGTESRIRGTKSRITCYRIHDKFFKLNASINLKNTYKPIYGCMLVNKKSMDL